LKIIGIDIHDIMMIFKVTWRTW